MRIDTRQGKGWIAKLGLAAAIVAGACLGPGAAGVSAGSKGGSDCIVQTASGPLDLNVFFEVAARIVIPPCNQIGSGQPWTPGAVWFMNTTFATVPAGFQPAGATPLDDFLAKFSGATYVVDRGTTEEKTYTFSGTGKLFVGTMFGSPIVNTVTMATLKPLSAGQHVVEVYWSFTAMHCDGFGDVILTSVIGDGNCIPPGEHLYWAIPFTVTADRH